MDTQKLQVLKYPDENNSKRILADLFRLTQRRADNLWEQYAPKPALREIYTLN